MDNIKLISPDGNASFNAKATDVNVQIKKDIITDTLDANLSAHTGTGLNINKRTYTITININNVSDNDYPNDVHNNYTNHNDGYAIELEKAVNDWGTIITADGEDNATLIWERGGIKQEKNGSLISVNLNKNATENTNKYTANIEFEELDFVW